MENGHSREKFIIRKEIINAIHTCSEDVDKEEQREERKNLNKALFILESVFLHPSPYIAE